MWQPVLSKVTDADGRPIYDIMDGLIRVGTAAGENNANLLCEVHNNTPGHAVDVGELVNAVSSYFFHGQRKPEIEIVVREGLRVR